MPAPATRGKIRRPPRARRSGIRLKALNETNLERAVLLALNDDDPVVFFKYLKSCHTGLFVRLLERLLPERPAKEPKGGPPVLPPAGPAVVVKFEIRGEAEPRTIDVSPVRPAVPAGSGARRIGAGGKSGGGSQ